MFKIVEVYFDLVYLLLMMGFGLALLLEKGKRAKLLAAMAILLALGDACHLLPRVYGHLSPGGLAGNRMYLSYGQMITSLTMSVFYLLYFYYYRSAGGKATKGRQWTLFCFLALRVVLVLLPANNWGGESPYAMALIRNIPFLIMGLALVAWTYGDREISGFKRASYLIAASFFFYALVVIVSPFIPAFGAFMLPKTICYILLVDGLYEKEAGKVDGRKIGKGAVVCLELGLLLGALYREFTRINGFTKRTTLSLAHPHMLLLGAVFSFALFLYLRVEKEDGRNLHKNYRFYLLTIYYFIASLVIRGIYTLASGGAALYPDGALSGMAGLGHIALTISIIALILKARREEQAIEQTA